MGVNVGFEYYPKTLSQERCGKVSGSHWKLSLDPDISVGGG